MQHMQRNAGLSIAMAQPWAFGQQHGVRDAVYGKAATIT